MASGASPLPSTITSTILTTATVTSATITATTTRTVYDRDPYLAFQPAFAYSLPVQFLLTGVILALSTTLLIHLIFTAPYHWPLAKLNYGLQLSGVVSLLLSIGVMMSVILGAAHGTSREWPYMLNYVAVDVPLQNWTQIESGLWYTLDAVTSGLAHATHIQFLTFLYPSRIEERLILGLLGPLVLMASIASLLPLSEAGSTRAIAESIKNICNSTLAILFSIALCVWGSFINRKEAWRTDGGTAIFGAGAVTLSLFSMGIARVPPVWIPPLTWTVVLWQSFLGWWWYVGSAAPELPSRNRKRKRAKASHKSHRGRVEEDEQARLMRVRTKLGLKDSRVRRRTRNEETTEDEQGSGTRRAEEQRESSVERETSPSAKETTQISPMLARLPAPLYRWLLVLRQEHLNAREQQAAANEQRQFAMYGNDRARGVMGNGWGLGSFALRAAADQRAMEGGEADERDRNTRAGGRLSDEGDASLEMQGMGERDDQPRRNIWGDEEPRRATEPERPPIDRELGTPKSSWSWMGPFRRWRLRDMTSY
ncbi:hypothetical protein FRC17_005495 [Serendipita sp. 399]|nr:hypothetical protein FRC17_005495 [Serendipita sp. 399]